MILNKPKDETENQTNLILFEQMNREYDVEVKKVSNTYSAKQRRALHLWCTRLAEALNDAGMYRIKVSPLDRSEMEINWTMESVKMDIYKTVLESLSGKTSTEEQNSVDPSDVAMHITRHFASKGFVCPAWPSYR